MSPFFVSSLPTRVTSHLSQHFVNQLNNLQFNSWTFWISQKVKLIKFDKKQIKTDYLCPSLHLSPISVSGLLNFVWICFQNYNSGSKSVPGCHYKGRVDQILIKLTHFVCPLMCTSPRPKNYISWKHLFKENINIKHSTFNIDIGLLHTIHGYNIKIKIVI